MSASQKTPQLFFRQAEGLPRAAERFSLLLLDEGEVYIDDQSAVYYPPDEKNPMLLDASHRILFVFFPIHHLHPNHFSMFMYGDETED